MTSPPATPSRLLTTPMARPKSTPATIQTTECAGSSAGAPPGRNPSTISATADDEQEAEDHPFQPCIAEVTEEGGSGPGGNHGAGDQGGDRGRVGRHRHERERARADDERCRDRDDADRQVQRYGLPWGIAERTDEDRESKLGAAETDQTTKDRDRYGHAERLDRPPPHRGNQRLSSHTRRIAGEWRKGNDRAAGDPARRRPAWRQQR